MRGWTLFLTISLPNTMKNKASKVLRAVTHPCSSTRQPLGLICVGCWTRVLPRVGGFAHFPATSDALWQVLFKKVVSASAIRSAHVPLTIVYWLEYQCGSARCLKSESVTWIKIQQRDCESWRWNFGTDSCTHHCSQHRAATPLALQALLQMRLKMAPNHALILSKHSFLDKTACVQFLCNSVPVHDCSFSFIVEKKREKEKIYI